MLYKVLKALRCMLTVQSLRVLRVRVRSQNYRLEVKCSQDQLFTRLELQITLCRDNATTIDCDIC
jgi:CYTH domain-containing protein